MRVVLVFPPGASATTVPMGIASLAPYMETCAPGTRVRLLDLNIAAWLWMAGADPQGTDLLDFVQGRRGNFLDHTATDAARTIWNRLRHGMNTLSHRISRYLATGDTDPECRAFLAFQTEQILMYEPDLVGLSVLFPEQLPFAAALCRMVRQALAAPGGPSGCRVVMGGAMMSALSCSDLLIALPELDGIVRGEGEAAAAALCTGRDWESVPGLIRRNGTGIVSPPKPPALSLQTLPAPDYSRLPMGAYFNPEPVLPVLFSRGCAWRKCRFCAHNFSFAGYRKKNAGMFVSELSGYQRELGARYFYSADEFIPPDDMDDIATEILARGLDIRFHVLGRPTGDYTPERMALWSAAGCRWIGWGVETGSQRLLDMINKGTKADVIRRVLSDAAAVGISNLALMIFGLPTSTDQDLADTFRFMDAVYDDIDALTASAFVLFEQTHFAKKAARYGLHVIGPQEILKTVHGTVRSGRLHFREIGTDGSLRTSRAAIEVAAWNRHRRWLGDPPLLERLPGEHCLIHLSGPGRAAPVRDNWSTDSEPAETV